MKKNKNYIAYIPIILAILGIIIGGAVRFNTVEGKAETTGKSVEKLENKVSEIEKEGAEEVESIKKEINESQLVDKEQTIKLENINEKVSDIKSDLKLILEEIKKKK